MGHFDVACFLTGLPIYGNDRVYVLFCEKSNEYWRGPGSNLLGAPGSTTQEYFWKLLIPPVQAEYNDYGAIEEHCFENRWLKWLMYHMDITTEEVINLFFRGEAVRDYDPDDYCTVFVSTAYERVPTNNLILNDLMAVTAPMLQELGFEAVVDINDFPDITVRLAGIEVNAEAAWIRLFRLDTNKGYGRSKYDGHVMQHDYTHYHVQNLRWLLENFNYGYLVRENVQWHHEVFWQHLRGNDNPLSYFNSVVDEYSAYLRFMLYCDRIGKVFQPTITLGQYTDNTNVVIEYADFLKQEANRFRGYAEEDYDE